MSIFKKNYFLFCCLFLICGLYSAHLGLDNNVEYQQYHYFCGYSFATFRYENDFAPCGIQSYFNPLCDWLYYSLSKALNDFPDLFCFLQGFWGALLMFWVFKIADLIFKGNGYLKGFSLFIALLIPITSFMFNHELGTMLVDMQVCFLPAAGVYLTLKAFKENEFSPKTFLLTGALFGAATGLKLTMASYALAMCIILGLYFKKIQNPIKIIGMYILGGMLGFAVTGGFWSIFLYKMFQNPFFPNWNNIFKSEWTLPISYAYEGFFPKNFKEALIYPFIWWKARVLPFDVYDFRWITVYVLGIFSAAFPILKDKIRLFAKADETIDCNLYGIFLAFVGITYIIWLKVFAVLRYLALIDAFGGIIIVAGIVGFCSLINQKKLSVLILCGICFWFYKTTICLNFFWRNVGNEKIFEFEDMKIPDGSIVFTGGLGASLAAVSQNPNVHFFGLYTDSITPFYYSEKAKQKAAEMIENADGKLYVLQATEPWDDMGDAYDAKFLTDLSTCKVIPNNQNLTYGLCRVKKRELMPWEPEERVETEQKS